MRGFSLRRTVAFYRSRSSPPPPPIAFTLYFSLRSLSPPLIIAALSGERGSGISLLRRQSQDRRFGLCVMWGSRLKVARVTVETSHSSSATDFLLADLTRLKSDPTRRLYSVRLCCSFIPATKQMKNVERKKGYNIEGTIKPNKDTKKNPWNESAASQWLLG